MGSQLTLTAGEQQEQGCHTVESEPEAEGKSKASRYSHFTHKRCSLTPYNNEEHVQEQRSGSADMLVVTTLVCGNEAGPSSSQKVLSLSQGKQGTWPGTGTAVA